jgi:hypothetical protein
MKVEVWPRADGLTEIETPGGATRYRRRAEVDAFLAGFRAAHRAIRDAVREIEVDDRRPIEPPPETKS